MKVSQVFGSKYLKAADIRKPVIVEIADCTEEMVGNGPHAEVKHVLHFRGMKQALVLKKTNAEFLAQHLSDDSDAWVGKKIVLFNDPTMAFAGSTGGIRIREAPSTAPTPTQAVDETDVPF